MRLNDIDEMENTKRSDQIVPADTLKEIISKLD